VGFPKESPFGLPFGLPVREVHVKPSDTDFFWELPKEVPLGVSFRKLHGMRMGWDEDGVG